MNDVPHDQARWLLFAFSVGVLAPLGTQAADDPTINRLLASQCSQCHGANGHALGDIDSIAGESRSELTEEMTEPLYEGDTQDLGLMEHQALGYTQDQIRRIADHYARQPRNDPDPLTPPLALGGGTADCGDEDCGDRDSDREWSREDEWSRSHDRDHERDHD